MLGLYGILNLGARSLQTEQVGTEVTGHNIANVNNSAYTRQRVSIATATPLPSSIGSEGNGASAVAIQQVRDGLLDAQIQTEASVTGSLTAQQNALEQGQSALGLSIDQSTSGASSAAGSDATGTQHGIGDSLNGLLNEFQNLANDPTSLSERQIVLSKAAELATQFNQADSRIGDVQNALNATLTGDVTQANQLLSDIAGLNQQISIAQASGGLPNDLLDTRQSKIEQLSGLIKIDVTNGDNGAVNISVGGNNLVSDSQVTDTIEAYDAGGGQMLLRTQNSGASLTPSGGAMQGIITVRDGALANLRSSINTLASNLISEVNQIHAGGYGLSDSTGAVFFTGTSAADIQVNSDLVANPSLLQASGTPGASGDNQTVLALAQLANKSITGLNNQTFSQSYTQSVTALGQAASSINDQVDDQKVVSNMLTQQRQSLSGVSLDEEMTNMLTYQRAYEASSKIVTAVDEMLSTVINMKQA